MRHILAYIMINISSCIDECDVPEDTEEPCNPVTDDQCSLMESCRITGSSTGFCAVPGPLRAGEHCDYISECGANMACVMLGDHPTLGTCVVVCDTLAPLERCSEDHSCVALWGPTGVCL